jgi:SGNH domain-containing protein
LIVFWRLCTGRPLLLHEQVLIGVFTAALAAALSALVETPMRAGSRGIGNRPALAGIFMATAVVAVVGTAVILDGGASWRMGATAGDALAALRAAGAERPRCIADKQWLAPAYTACRWNPEIQGTDFVIWGDSHAGALAPELAAVLSDGGKKSGVSVGIPHCSPIDAIVVAGHKYSKICPAFVDAVIKAIAREKPKIVVMVGRWAILASDMRAPGDGESSGRILDLENNRTPMQLADALTRTIERVRASGAQVILLGPVPEIEYDVPPTLVRSLQGIGRLPPVRRDDFDLRQEQVLSALAKISARGEALVLYPHTVLCNNETCAVADGIKSLYMDDDHLSPFGSARVSALVRSVIGRTEKGLAKSGAITVAAPGE